MEDKILKLTKLWYEYVGKDHHKDCDCHFYVSRMWSYGLTPYYRIEHYGYVFESKNNKHYKTYEQAERALYYDIRKAFRQELKWAKEVVVSPLDYDKIQVDRAKWLIKHYREE